VNIAFASGGAPMPTRTDIPQPLRILAVSSGGGHWEQLMLLREAFAGHEVRYATTVPGLPERSGIAEGVLLYDCNRNRLGRSLRCLTQALRLVATFRPHVVISTGAAPGLLCVAAGRLMGARTIWIDSIANVEVLSMSGRLARYFADLWLTQWHHLATPAGPRYEGELL
jgi:UDP-N-acetylglucosamine:LPS N-acetylglucosamine transferase